jgi:DNA-binding MurR/RpiR family transcriptional regulator
MLRADAANRTITDRIRDKEEAFTAAERKVAELLLTRGHEAVFDTIMELARSAGVSETSVVRCARALGFDGFRDLQEQLKREMLGRLFAPLPVRRREKLQGFQGSLQESLDAEIECLRQSYVNVNGESFAELARRLAGARQVFVIGGSSSAPAALFAAFYLSMLRGGVTPIVSSDFLAHAILDANGEDCIVAFVFARYSQHTVELLQLAHSAGTFICCFTDGGSGPHVSLANQLIMVKRDSSHFLASYTAAMSLVYTLVGQVGHQLGDETEERLERFEEFAARQRYGITRLL